MAQYTVRRILAAIPVLFGVLAVTFVLARAVPGEPCKSILGEKATQEACERFNREKGLDEPLPTQFAIYVADIAQGDLGESIRFKRPISEILIERLPVTIELGITALVIAVAVGIPLGIISATRHNSSVDVLTMIGANIGVSMPVFWLGLMLAYLFAIVFKDTPLQLPPSGRLSPGMFPDPFFEVFEWEVAEGTLRAAILRMLGNMVILNSVVIRDWEVLVDAIRHLILPSVALSTIPMAIIARMTRSSMLEVLGLDYIRTARAKGVPKRKVVFKHAFRNALLPVVTIIGLQLGLVLGGAILTESVFALSGVGRALFEAITARDYPIIQGFTLVIAVGYVGANLLVDLSYAFLDPRIKFD